MLARYKTHIAAMFHHFPWLGAIGQRIWQFGQARFSVGTIGVVFDDAGRILLLHHVFRSRYSWGLPGGWVERRENPADTIVREVLEETGLRVRVVCPLLIDLGIHHPNHLDLAYLCELEGGEIRLSNEILGYRWSEPSELPKLFETQQRAVELALRQREAVVP